MDVEGAELNCFENWFETDVFKNVDQLGIEIHISNKVVKSKMKQKFTEFNNFLIKLLNDYGLYLVDSEPNRLIEKIEDGQKIYYSYNDLLFVKPLNI